MVNVEASTVTDSDVSPKRTTAPVIPETHSSLHSPLVYCRVTSIEPTRVPCATTIPINTSLCHMISNFSTKSVPVGRQHTITLISRSMICFRSAGLVKNFVIVTFYERKENSVYCNLSNFVYLLSFSYYSYMSLSCF